MNFSEYIDEIGSKYSYDKELVDELKRIVPVMAEGKSKPEVQLIIEFKYLFLINNQLESKLMH